MEERPTLAEIGAALTRSVRLMSMSTPSPLQTPVPPAGISEEDWIATPVTVRVLVTELLQRKARHKQTARKSSTSPSAVPPSAKPRPVKAPSGRTLGGELGHEGHGR